MDPHGKSGVAPQRRTRTEAKLVHEQNGQRTFVVVLPALCRRPRSRHPRTRVFGRVGGQTG